MLRLDHALAVLIVSSAVRPYLLLTSAADSHTDRFEDMNDLLGTVIQELHKFEEAKIDPECTPACSGPEHMNLYPAPKQRNRPYSNGCSMPDALKLEIGEVSQFTECCDVHDACYSSCGVSKKLCDTEFKACMLKTCAGTEGSEKTRCQNFSSILAQGHQFFGCLGYTERQEDHCECLSREQARERLEEYANEFYQAYNQTLTAAPERLLKRYLEHHESLPQEKQNHKHGELLYRMYKRYPKSIEILTRDGKVRRIGDRLFVPSAARGGEL